MMKMAIIGVGDHAVRAHVVHLAKNADCTLVGGFDPNPQAFSDLKSNHGIALSPYESYEAVLADKNVDSVLISTPDSLHLPQLEAAVASGRSVFCEKPLCTSEGELVRLERVFDMAAQKGIQITSCHPRRYDPPYQWLKKNLADLEQRYGKVVWVGLDFSYHEPDQGKGHLHGGSLLQDHANHEFDYISHLFGVSPTTMFKMVDEFDRYELAGARGDGVSFMFSGTRRLKNSIYPEVIRVRFARAELHIDTYDARNTRLVQHDNIVHDPSGCKVKTDAFLLNVPVTDYETRFKTMNDDWVACLLGKKPNYLTPDEMLRNTRASVGLHNSRLLDI